MRIGMMADGYKPHVSGITNIIDLNKRYLEKADHEVFVFTFGGDEFVDDEPNIIRTRGLPLVDTGYYISIRYNNHAQKLLSTMDIVHVHHPFTSGRLALRYCKPNGIPILFTNHTRYDLYAHAYLPMVPEAFGDAFLRSYMPSFCNSCDLVIAPSPGLRDVLVDLGVTANIEVVPNAVNIEPFQSPNEIIPRQKLGFKDTDIILCYMGRIGPEKNLPFLLRAFAGITKTYDGVKLLVIGDGPERENIEDRARIMSIADRVKFTGMIPYSNLPSYMAVADAFVTASVSEVHPLSVIEAQASGLPIVGIRSPGIEDIVQDGITGYLAEEEDLAVFTAKVSRMVVDTEKREKMAREAWQAASRYSIEKTAQIMLEHYQRLVNKSSKRRVSIFNRIMRPFKRNMN